MNFEPDIELYCQDGIEVVYNDLLRSLGEEFTLKVEKKLTLYSHQSIETLLRTKHLDLINGTRNPRLYELKIKSIPTPVRFVCALEGRVLVLLDVFFSSGSKGRAEKHLARATTRLVYWRSHNA